MSRLGEGNSTFSYPAGVVREISVLKLVFAFEKKTHTGAHCVDLRDKLDYRYDVIRSLEGLHTAS